MLYYRQKSNVSVMGIYLNPNYNGFKQSVNSRIYVDKTGLIEFTNSVITIKILVTIR